MSKASKVILAIFIPLFIIALVCYLIAILNKPVEYPGSTLVYSVFTAENNVYKAQSDFTDRYTLNNVPYTIDVPVADKAHIGNGIIYSVDPSTLNYVYLSEMSSIDTLDIDILAEFPKAVLYNYNENTSIEDVLVDAGYINGFGANYFVKRLTITDGNNIREVMMVGYLILIPETDQLFLISVTTNDITTDNLAYLKKVSDALLYTVRYDEELDNKRIKEEEEAAKKAAREAEENSSDVEFDTVSDEGGLPSVPENATVEIKNIDIETTYDNTSVVVSWSNPSTMISVRLTDDQGIIYYDASSYDRGNAIIDLGYIEPGSYSLEITGLDYGDISYNIIDSTPIEQPDAEPEEDVINHDSDETMEEE